MQMSIFDEVGRALPKDVMDSLFHQARACHPDIPLSAEQFQPFVARSLSAGSSDAALLDRLHISDLYLACAYGLGYEAAHKRVEAEYFVPIARRLDRMQIPSSISAEILQDLRCRLVEMSGPEFSGRAYCGQGSLGGWLYIAAVRIAERHSARMRNELPAEDNCVAVLERQIPVIDPELDHLIHSYKSVFESALRAGLAALSSRERNLLRYHFLEQLSIDRLAEIYGVHRATAARWILRAQCHLSQETRTHFVAQIPVGEHSMARLLGFSRSRLELGLSRLLPSAPETEV